MLSEHQKTIDVQELFGAASPSQSPADIFADDREGYRAAFRKLVALQPEIELKTEPEVWFFRSIGELSRFCHNAEDEVPKNSAVVFVDSPNGKPGHAGNSSDDLPTSR